MELQIQKGRPMDVENRSAKEIRTYNLLDSIKIEYDRIDHEAVETMAACQEIDALLVPAVVCKNLLLCNSQKNKFYLLMIAGDKRFDARKISDQIGSSRLSFAPQEYMEQFLDIRPGSVSIMGLMNDKENRVQLLVDEEILSYDYLGCHPCVNTTSLKIRTGDILEKFLHEVHHEYKLVQVSG